MSDAGTSAEDERLAAYREAAARADRPPALTATRLARHAAAAARLAEAGETTLARGARVVAGVVTLRLALTPAGSVRDWTMKWPICLRASRMLEPERRERLDPLLDHARDREVDARLSAGLPIGSVDAAAGARAPAGDLERRSATTWPSSRDLSRYRWAAAMDADLTPAIRHARLVVEDMARLARSAPDLAAAARAELADVSLALCVRLPLSPLDAEDQHRLLEILADALPDRPATVAVVRVATEAEGRRWGAATSGSA